MRTKATIALVMAIALSPGNAVARHSTAETFHPTVLSRSAWGADESLGIVTNVETPASTSSAQARASPGKAARQPQTSQPQSLSERERACNETARAYPEDFRVRRVETHNQNGEEYVWERQYSPAVKLLVIHHTGETETPEREKLSGIERVRAIYRGHTVNNGWGDIGYHFLIDRGGIIYEGRAGGPNVVGGHVYCANVGTIGIALIGNFLRNSPTGAQLQSLRWLLADLSETYRLRPNGKTRFHGKVMPTIVTHRDLGPSQDPGRRFLSLMPKIRRLVAARDFTTAILPRETTGTIAEASRKGTLPETVQSSRQPGRITYTKTIPRRVQRRMEKGGDITLRLRLSRSQSRDSGSSLPAGEAGAAASRRSIDKRK